MRSAFYRPSIGFDRPSSIPPIPPSAIEPRFGPWAARLGRPLEGRKIDLNLSYTAVTPTPPHSPSALCSVDRHRVTGYHCPLAIEFADTVQTRPATAANMLVFRPFVSIGPMM